MLPTRNVIENVVCVNCRYMCCHKKKVLWTAVASLLYEVYSIQLNGTGKVLQKFTFNMCLWYATLHTSTWPSFRVVVFEWTKFFSQDQWNRDAEKKKKFLCSLTCDVSCVLYPLLTTCALKSICGHLVFTCCKLQHFWTWAVSLPLETSIYKFRERMSIAL